MAEYPFTHCWYKFTIVSVMYDDKSYIKWVMEKQDVTDPVLKFQKYEITRRAASSSPEPPATPKTGPSSPMHPTTDLPSLPRSPLST